MYGAEPGKASFGDNCLLARRLVERGVRFVQLYPRRLGPPRRRRPACSNKLSARRSTRPSAALVQDLKQRGLLDDTLVIWGGEFGRTPMLKATETDQPGPRPPPGRFTMWMAGGGVKLRPDATARPTTSASTSSRTPSTSTTYARILHLLGLDHEKLTYKFQGRPFRLTGRPRGGCETAARVAQWRDSNAPTGLPRRDSGAHSPPSLRCRVAANRIQIRETGWMRPSVRDFSSSRSCQLPLSPHRRPPPSRHQVAPRGSR